MGAAGQPLPEEHLGAPEQYAEALLREIRRALGWAGELLQPVLSELERLGADWRRLLDGTPALPPHAEVKRIVAGLRDGVLSALAFEIDVQRRAQIELRLEAGLASLPSFPWLSVARQALGALRSKDVGAYALAIEELWRLRSLRSGVERRYELLRKIEAVAKAWAEAVRARATNHLGPLPPGTIREAWLYRQWTEELNRRHRVDIQELQRELGQVKDQLRDTTARLVETLAWAAQVRRTAPAQHRALMSGSIWSGALVRARESVLTSSSAKPGANWIRRATLCPSGSCLSPASRRPSSRERTAST